MAKNRLAAGLVFGLAVLALTACGGEKPVDVEAITAKPQTFVGLILARCAIWSTTIPGK